MREKAIFLCFLAALAGGSPALLGVLFAFWPLVIGGLVWMITFGTVMLVLIAYDACKE